MNDSGESLPGGDADHLPAVSRGRAVAALVALSTGAFCFVTAELLPIGLLTLIARDLDHTESSIGLLVTGYAVVVMVASVPLTRVTRRLPRRALLGGTLAVFVLSTLVSAAATDYTLLLVARLFTALGQAVFGPSPGPRSPRCSRPGYAAGWCPSWRSGPHSARCSACPPAYGSASRPGGGPRSRC